MTLELRDRQAKASVLGVKFDTVSSRHAGTDQGGGEEPKSQAYYIVKVSPGACSCSRQMRAWNSLLLLRDLPALLAAIVRNCVSCWVHFWCLGWPSSAAGSCARASSAV